MASYAERTDLMDMPKDPSGTVNLQSLALRPPDPHALADAGWPGVGLPCSSNDDRPLGDATEGSANEASPVFAGPEQDFLFDVSILNDNLTKLSAALEVLFAREEPIKAEELAMISTIVRMTQQSTRDVASRLDDCLEHGACSAMPGILRSLHAALG
ncbi:MAG: hypothetical protein AAFY97_02325 [Pseudomonadota bacterium]